ncbi:hypothetical protein VMCG_06042 [Cytospora schulzeri]|uniref:Uncharacterized protein n=1 Tax=Cytospora schulzeri TaxID=448051 RepID=A0A423WGL1_9PEZI|nr:hypothetical protein VMCG_06042 [Valsa malicola]
MSLNILSRVFPTLLILSLTSPPASGKPLPPETVNPSLKIEARSSTGNGGLQTWEIIVIVLGAVIGIMLIGGLGGACEVMLHTRGKIVQSNAEADAKVEAGGHRALELEPGEDKGEDTGSDAPTEVEEVDPGRFSWQPEKMTTGEGMAEDRALSEVDTDGSSQTTLNGEQSSVNDTGEPMHDVDLSFNLPAPDSSEMGFYQEQTRDRVLPWEGQMHPDPALAQFVIGEEEGPDYEGEEAAGYDHHQDHFAEPVAMPDEADFQHANAGYGHQENTWHHEADSNPNEESKEPNHEHIGEALAVAPVGDYAGEGYSPAAIPDDVDYLADYRQSQIYLQQEDDWQQYYGKSHGSSGTDHEQEGHGTQESVVPHPDPGYF